MIGYLTLILGLIIVAGVVWASVWLVRRREAGTQQTSDAGDGLRRAAEMLGLDEVRESRLYQARILTAWGEINEFRVVCELWEQVQNPFYRVTIGFPKPLQRGIRISRDAQGGLLHRVMETESENAPGEILVQSNHDIDELRTFLQDDLRKPLEHLATRVNRLQMGDEYLYLWVKSAPDGAFCESILRESLAVAKRVFGRAVELGPSKKSTLTSSYGQAKSEMSRRAVDIVEGEERPEEVRQTGRVTLSSMAAISREVVNVESNDREKAASIWDRKLVEPASIEEVESMETTTVTEQAEPKRIVTSTLPGVGKMGVE